MNNKILEKIKQIDAQIAELKNSRQQIAESDEEYANYLARFYPIEGVHEPLDINEYYRAVADYQRTSRAFNDVMRDEGVEAAMRTLRDDMIRAERLVAA